MAKVLVVYATRSNETKRIGELISEGIRFGGDEAKCVNITEIKKEGRDFLSPLWGSLALKRPPRSWWTADSGTHPGNDDRL